MSPPPGTINFGRRVSVLRSRSGRLSWRADARAIITVAVLTIAALAVGLVTLGVGDYPVTPAAVLRVLFGAGETADRLVVLEWRLPRTLLALVLGAALGTSGAIFQSITRNALGSPDVIGFNTGAYTGALIAILLLDLGYFGIAGGALVGGMLTALLVYTFAFKRGVSGYRLIIVGIAVSAILSSINTWLILTSELSKSMTAATWGAGNLSGLKWEQAAPTLVLLAVLVPPLVIAARRLAVLDLGDDTATALGLHTGRTRLGLIALAVALVAIATAAAGPIAFVALVAPQVARRLTRSPGVSMVPAAATGALLLALSDLIAQRMLAPLQLPVGVVTVSLGGAYLVWLLVHTARSTARSHHH